MSYLGINPADSAVINKREYIATAGQTTFPCLYDEYVEVYLNGSRLAADDFTATDGMNVVLTLAAEADDVIVCSGYENARFDNSVSTTGTDTISGVKTFTAQPVGIVKASVGLSNVDNTSDADKPISTATQTALNLKANQATTYTKAETDTAIANLVDSAPTALNTLNELASALGDDVNFSTTVANNIGTVSSNLSSHASNTSNPHSVTKTQVGLGNVTNDAQVKTVTSTDNAVVRFDGTTGQVQNSGVIVDDSGNIITLDNDKGILLSPDKGGGASIKYASNGNLEITPRSGFSTVITAGNVGIGVAPKGFIYTALQLKNTASAVGTTGVDRYNLTNAYFDGAWKRITTTHKPTRYAEYDGGYAWASGDAGAADGTITWTPTMTLEGNGNLLVGTTTDNGEKLQVVQNSIGNHGVRISSDQPDGSTVRFVNSDTNGRSYAVGSTGGSSGAGVGFSVYDLSSSSSKLLIPASGNLLVGTSTDNGVDKLQVNGSINVTNFVSTYGEIKHFNYYRVLSNTSFVIDFTLIGDSSFDIEVIRSQSNSAQFNKYVFTQMAGVGNYVAVNNQTSCTVSLISSSFNAYRYSLTVPNQGGYAGYSVFVKFRSAIINSYS